MVDVWPVTLPDCFNVVDSISTSIGDGRLISQMDAGPAKVRRRSSAMPRPLRGSMRMTTAQIATLKTFVETTLIGGSLPFTFTDPHTQLPILVRLAESMPNIEKRALGVNIVTLDFEVLP